MTKTVRKIENEIDEESVNKINDEKCNDDIEKDIEACRMRLKFFLEILFQDFISFTQYITISN